MCFWPKVFIGTLFLKIKLKLKMADPMWRPKLANNYEKYCSHANYVLNFFSVSIYN